MREPPALGPVGPRVSEKLIALLLITHRSFEVVQERSCRATSLPKGARVGHRRGLISCGPTERLDSTSWARRFQNSPVLTTLTARRTQWTLSHVHGLTLTTT